MGQFLRDQKLANVTLDEAALNRLNGIFLARVATHNAFVPQEQSHSLGISFYVVRFDDRGYRFINFNDVLKDYSEAGTVERDIFTMEAPEYRQSGFAFRYNNRDKPAEMFHRLVRQVSKA
jgi:hypothetical protein